MNSSGDTISERDHDVIDKLRGAADEMGALPWEVTADSVMAGPVRHRRFSSPIILRVAVVVFVALTVAVAVLVGTSKHSSTIGTTGTASDIATLADLDVVSDQLLYAYAPDSAGWNLVRSTDGGSQWQNVGKLARSCDVVGLAFINKQQGVADCGVDLMATGDGGRTWTTARVPGVPVYGFDVADVGNVLVAQDGTIWAEMTRCKGSVTVELVCPATIFASTTGGASWVESGFSIHPWSLEPSLVITGPESGYFLQGGPLPLDGPSYGMPYGDRYVASSLFVTSDDWKTWTTLPDPCNENPEPTDATLVASSPTDLVLDCDWVPSPTGGTAPAETSNEYRYIYTSVDGGRSWVLTSTTRAKRPAGVGLLPSYRWGAGYSAGEEPVAANGAMSLWVQPSLEALLHSDDGGHKWAPVSLGGGWELDLGGGAIPSLQWIDFVNADDGFLVAGGFYPAGQFSTAAYPLGLWSTTDGGRSWSEALTFDQTNVTRDVTTLKQAVSDESLALEGLGLASADVSSTSYVTTDVAAIRSDPSFAAALRREYKTEPASTRVWLFELRGDFQLQSICGATYAANCAPFGAVTIAVVSGSVLPPLSVEIATDLSAYGSPHAVPRSLLNQCALGIGCPIGEPLVTQATR
jgi:hypothetical protein